MTVLKALRIFDSVVIFGVAFICVIVTFLGLIGEGKIGSWVINYSYVSCVLLSTIAVHLYIAGLKHKQIEDKIDNSTTTIIHSVKGVNKIIFDSIQEVDLYVAQRIKSARFSVYDLNWQDFRSPQLTHTPDREAIDDIIDKSISAFCLKNRNAREKEEAIYEEIFTFPTHNKQNLSKMKQRISFGNVYTCSYYETTGVLKFPKIQFVVIDEEEVIFVSSEYKENFCAVKDKRIVNICMNYFMQARTLSTCIKEKKKIANQQIINAIETKYQT